MLAIVLSVLAILVLAGFVGYMEWDRRVKIQLLEEYEASRKELAAAAKKIAEKHLSGREPESDKAGEDGPSK